MDLLNIQNLALGGVVAAVVGFWSQVRNVLRYISSAVVVQASLDHTLSYSVTMFAKSNWNQFPTGIQMFRAIYLLMKDGSWRHVPYRSLTQNMLFYKGWKFFWLTLTQDGVAKVVYIRGVMKAEDLIVDGLTHSDKKTSVQREDRFMVVPVMGMEKGMWANTSNSRGGEEIAERSASSSDSPISSANVFVPDHNTDRSFMYSKGDIQFNATQDPLEGLFYEDSTLNHLKDAVRWLDSEKWYAERSIPWKRGWLIHGPGGTGKSSLSLVTAKTLKVPLYKYMLSTLSDQEFVSRWKGMQVPCVALFEDFDTVFNKREPLTEHKSLTFDCVLNEISGVKNLSGVFLIVTTNHIENIDEALGVPSGSGTISTRPGRIDHVIYLGPATGPQKRSMVEHILRDWPEAHEDLLARSEGYTAVQFQEACISYAFHHMSLEDSTPKESS